MVKKPIKKTTKRNPKREVSDKRIKYLDSDIKVYEDQITGNAYIKLTDYLKQVDLSKSDKDKIREYLYDYYIDDYRNNKYLVRDSELFNFWNLELKLPKAWLFIFFNESNQLVGYIDIVN